MGLSEKMINKWHKNLIILEGISCTTSNDSKNIKLCEFDSFTLGDNILDYLEKYNILPDSNNISLNVSRISQNFVAMVTKLDEVEQKFPSIESMPKQADYILLALITCGDVSKCTSWLDDMKRDADYCMYNQVTKQTSHFKTRGSVYSFGLHGLFKKNEDLSTVGNYCTKKKSDLAKSLRNKLMEDCVKDMENGINTISKIDPRIHKLIAPCCSLLANELQEQLGIESSIKNTVYPFLSAHLNINVTTDLFHTEQDVTYTLICVPKQSNSKFIARTAMFLFRINWSQMFQFTMFQGFSMIYSAMLLTHRQEISKTDHIIMNTSGYGNKKLFCHIRSSLQNSLKVSTCLDLVWYFFPFHY